MALVDGGAAMSDGGGTTRADCGGSGGGVGGVAGGAGVVVQYYTFDLNVDARPRVAATFSDVDASFGAALAGIMAHDHLQPMVPAEGCEWTIVAHAHEQLAGPQARAARAAAGAEDDDATGGDGVIGCEGEWARIEAGDELGRLAQPLAPEVGRRVIKKVRAGPLAVDLWFEVVGAW